MVILGEKMGHLTHCKSWQSISMCGKILGKAWIQQETPSSELYVQDC